MVFIFKPFEIRLLKVGRVMKHITKTAGKLYSKSKLYLKNDDFADCKYELYDMGRVHLHECDGHVKGRAMLIFVPDKPRHKKDIRM
ncbi:MAG: hypothetical protein ABIG84_08295 [archaeon]